MARIGISITKSTSFRNATQEFSNVYYYDGLTTAPNESQASDLIDELVAKEKTWHSSVVTFVRARLWHQTGDKATTEMILQKNLSGTGARATAGSMDKERAFLFRIRAGNDSRGKPVYLRKWFHACGVFYSGQGITTAQLENTNGFSSGERASMVAQLGAIGSIGSGGTLGTICSKVGRTTTAGEPWVAHPFLEHHQLGDQWRAA